MWKKLDKNCEPEQYRKSESNQSTKNGILQLYGQHDWRGKVLAGQVTILARCCPLTSRNFES